MSVRLKRLAADFDNIGRAFDNHPYIRIVEAEGDPPERYKVEFHMKGLAIQDGKVVTKLTHLAEVYLPLGYPRQAPQCRMLSPVYHPNIAPHAICIGDHWSAGESLAALIARIGELLTYQSYNVKSPLNGEAARWVEQNMDRLPIQKIDLSVDVEGMQAAKVPVATAAPEAPIEVIPVAPAVKFASALTSVEKGAAFPYDEWLSAVRTELKGDPIAEAIGLPLTSVVSNLKTGRIPEAIKSFEAIRTARGAGKLPQVHFLVAMLQGAQQKPDRALGALENAVTADRTYALAWYYSGVVAAGAGQREKARKGYAKYLELNPGSEAAKHRLAAI